MKLALANSYGVSELIERPPSFQVCISPRFSRIRSIRNFLPLVTNYLVAVRHYRRGPDVPVASSRARLGWKKKKKRTLPYEKKRSKGGECTCYRTTACTAWTDAGQHHPPSGLPTWYQFYRPLIANLGKSSDVTKTSRPVKGGSANLYVSRENSQ